MQRRALLRGLTGLAALPAMLAGFDGWAGTIVARGAHREIADRRLDGAEERLVAAIADGIVPATSTPGAIGAGVPEFIALLYAEWMLADEQTTFTAGLRALDARARTDTGSAFLDLSPAAQFAQLSAWDREVAAARLARTPAPFFARMRGLVLVAYYSSQVGYEQELAVQFGGGGDRPGGPVFGAVPFKI